MQLISSRTCPVLDTNSLTEYVGRNTLFRSPKGFLLHMLSEGKPDGEGHILQLDGREALIWLNETPDQFGSFWPTVQPLSYVDCATAVRPACFDG
jgi:hypothetical protein